MGFNSFIIDQNFIEKTIIYDLIYLITFYNIVKITQSIIKLILLIMILILNT